MTTDVSGCLEVSTEMFEQVERDEGSLDVMARNDLRLVRFVNALIPSRKTAMDLAGRRGGSGWPVMGLEDRLYGNMPALLEAYAPTNSDDVEDAAGLLDLETGKDEIVIRVARRGSPKRV